MKKHAAILLALMLGINIGICSSVNADMRSEEKIETTEEISETENTVEPGARTATIMVVSITGNELTYYESEEENGKEDTSQENSTKEVSEEENSTKEASEEDDREEDSQGRSQKKADFSSRNRKEMKNVKTVYLPVPVVVHTDTNEKMTFSILQAGDKLEVTVITDEQGNETITEIWMLNEKEDAE